MEIRYTIFVLGLKEPYCIKELSDSNSKYTEDDIISMLDLLVDTFYWSAGERFKTYNQHSNRYKLCPSHRRHISVRMRSGIYKSLLPAEEKQLATKFDIT